MTTQALSNGYQLAEDQDQLGLNPSGIRGMDVTQAELREAGKTISGVVVRHLEAADDDDTSGLLWRGALAEVLLALGIGTELTVRGRVANRAYLSSPSPPIIDEVMTVEGEPA